MSFPLLDEHFAFERCDRPSVERVNARNELLRQ